MFLGLCLSECSLYCERRVRLCNFKMCVCWGSFSWGNWLRSADSENWHTHTHRLCSVRWPVSWPSLHVGVYRTTGTKPDLHVKRLKIFPGILPLTFHFLMLSLFCSVSQSEVLISHMHCFQFTHFSASHSLSFSDFMSYTSFSLLVFQSLSYNHSS